MILQAYRITFMWMQKWLVPPFSLIWGVALGTKQKLEFDIDTLDAHRPGCVGWNFLFLSRCFAFALASVRGLSYIPR